MTRTDQLTWSDLAAAHERTRGGAVAAAEHAPKAAILACSDARVPPSVIFDQPAGSLFVVRIAGNTATPAALASLDFAVDQLGVSLLVVLGHTGCGAVEAAASGSCGGHLAPIVGSICAIARDHPGATVDRLVALNVARTLQRLVGHDGPAGRAARAGTLELRGAVHDLSTGALRTVSAPVHPTPSDPTPCDPTPTRVLLEAP